MTTTTNPWDLSKSEAAVIEAVLQTGSFKGAARILCRSEKTICTHVSAARQRMGVSSGSRHAHLLMWREWRLFSSVSDADVKRALEIGTPEAVRALIDNMPWTYK